jgi:hypothetical protein
VTPKVSDYIGRRRDSSWERDLAKRLRQEPESDRLEFVIGMLAANEVVGLELARRCLSERSSFKKILELGLMRANCNTMREWINAVIESLGERRLRRLLEIHRPKYPLPVSNACYWLPGRNTDTQDNTTEKPQ